MIKNLFQATLVTLFVYILNKNIKRGNLLLVYLLSFVFFCFTDRIQLNRQTQEGFSNTNIKRGIRFGDTISIYLPDIQHYMGVSTGSKNSTVGVYSETSGGEIKKTNEVLFTIESPYEPAGPGNTNYVQIPTTSNSANQFNVVCFRTVDNKYLAYDSGNMKKFYLVDSSKRSPNMVGFVLQSTKAEGGGSVIKYGDLILITQLGNQNTLHYNLSGDMNKNTNIFEFNSQRQNNRTIANKIEIKDQYGEGQQIDWAKRSVISAVSTSEEPRNIVDGLINTSCISGTGDKKGQIKIEFPRNIYINQCQFYTIRGQDQSQNSLSSLSENYIIKLYDSANTLLIEQRQDSLSFEQNDKKFVWDNVEMIAKSMVIDKIGNEPKLGFALVKVFGEAIEHSVLLEKPSLVDVYSGKNTSFGNGGETFIKMNDELPYTVRDMTLSFWFNHKVGNNVDSVELIKKGTGNINSGSQTEAETLKENVINLTPSVFLKKLPTGEGDRELNVITSCTDDLKDIISSNSNAYGEPEIIKENENYNVSIVIKYGIKKLVGWYRCDFFPTGSGYYDVNSANGIKYNPKGLDIALNNGLEKGSYMFNKMTGEYYVIPKSLSGLITSNESEYSTSSDIMSINKSPKDLNAIYRGVLDIARTESRILLYINGKKINEKKLNGDPIFNRNAMVIGGDSKFNGQIYDVKYANYAMTEDQLRMLSMKKTSNVVKILYPKGYEGAHLYKGFRPDKNNKDARLPLMSIPHINLPEYNKQFTLGFWLYTNPLALNKSSEVIFKKGSMLLERIENGKLRLRIGNMSLPDLVVPNKKFVHLCLVYGSDLLNASGDTTNLKSYKFNLYVNGNIKEDTRLFKGNVYDLTVRNTDFLNEYHPLTFGEFNGEIGKMIFANYAFNLNEIRDTMGEHPHTELNLQITKLFREGGECTGIPYDLHINPDSEEANLVKNLYKNDGDDGDNKPKLPEIKVELDKIRAMASTMKNNSAGISNDEDIELYKSAYKQCYRNDYGDLLGKQDDSEVTAEIHAEQKCLARAPNVCPPEKKITDFDISEHPDFFKAVRPSEVNKCPTLVQNKNINNFNVEELKRHKNFNTLKKSIEKNVDLGAVINGIEDPERLKSIVEKIVKTNKVELADLLGSSTTSPQMSGVSGAVMDGISSGSIDPSELLSNLNPTELTNIVTKVIKKGDLPVNKLLTILRDNQLIGNICKSGIQNGTVNANDLSGSTVGMNNSLASKCRAMDITLHPEYTKHFNKTLEDKLRKLNILKDGQLDNLNLNNYIHKDDIPCVGCKLASTKKGAAQAKQAAQNSQ